MMRTMYACCPSKPPKMHKCRIKQVVRGLDRGFSYWNALHSIYNLQSAIALGKLRNRREHGLIADHP